MEWTITKIDISILANNIQVDKNYKLYYFFEKNWQQINILKLRENQTP